MYIIKDLTGLILFSLLFVLNQWYFIPTQVIAEGSSSAYPYLLNSMLGFFIVCYALEALRVWKRADSKLALWHIQPAQLGKVIILLLTIWFWNTALEHYGFIIPTTIFLFFTSWLYGERNLLTMFLLAIITPLFLFVAFTLMGSMLPRSFIENALTTILVG